MVLDTNVIISALRSSQGASYEILMRLGQNSFQPCVTVSLMMEYESVSMRLIEKTSLTEDNIGDILDYLCATARRCKVHFLWRPTLKDPDDDMVLEAAVASGAKIIVTHNVRDFKGAETLGVRVLKPAAFLSIIRRKK